MAFSRIAEHFYTSGIHYYIAGRFSALAWFSPTAGNQFHHAVEMLLKGYLEKSHTESQRRGLSHGLAGLWQAFKTQVSDTTLDRFDNVIAELDKFEDLRYPERALAVNGAALLFDWSPAGSPRRSPHICGPGGVPDYTLYIADVDELVASVIKKCSFHLPSFVGLSSHAKEYLLTENSFIAGDPPDLL